MVGDENPRFGGGDDGSSEGNFKETTAGSKERRKVSGGGLSEARLERMHDTMAAYAERGDVPGMVTLVARRDEVRVDVVGTKAVGGGPMRCDTLFRIASMTKPVAAVAAMILVEECALRLDDPVDALLPELSDRSVLRSIDGPLDDTVPAERPITLRDLLTLRMGLGTIFAPPGRYPIQRAMDERGLSPGPELPALPPDEWMERLGELPLVHEPGQGWMYDTGSDVLGVLISRATGRSLEDFFRERIFVPLGMHDTGFRVPEAKLDRLADCYGADSETGTLAVFDAADDSAWGRPPVFESGAGGLVSTVGDYLAFCRMLLRGGAYDGGRVLSRPSVELMTTDNLTGEQKSDGEILLGDGVGWGFGMSVVTGRTGLASPGAFGWDGGYTTSGHSDPREEMVGILMTQRVAGNEISGMIHHDFWTSAYQTIND
jgi:CubicO group peptidase (beta-lactamase class C family)